MKGIASFLLIRFFGLKRGLAKFEMKLCQYDSRHLLGWLCHDARHNAQIEKKKGFCYNFCYKISDIFF